MWRTIGQDRAVDILKRAIHGGRLSHAYLLTGPPQVGKMTLALDLACAVNCRGDERPCGECDQCRRVDAGLHADIRVLEVDRQAREDGRRRVAIGIDQVREVQREASLKPFEGAFRVFIIDGAERLSLDAANSLLKTLEEPPDQVLLVLLASDASALLPTVESRCQQVKLRPLPVAKTAHELEARFGLDGDKALEIARISGGRIGWAIQAAENADLLESRSERLRTFEDAMAGGLERRFAYTASLAPVFGASRERVREEFELWLDWWRDVLLIKEGVPELVTNLSRMATLKASAEALSPARIASSVRAINETWEHLERNANPRLALDELMLSLP